MDKNKLLMQSLSHLNAALDAQGWPVLTAKKFPESARATVAVLSDGVVDYPAFLQVWAPQQSYDALQGKVRALQKETGSKQVVLLADYINPVMAERLNAGRILFADCCGNLYWRKERKTVFVKRRKDIRKARQHQRGRAFNPAGLKLIFAFFNRPDLLFRTYRDISENVGVALGSIGPVVNDLVVSGYMEKTATGLVLKNRKRLFERWVDAYLEKLRPRLLLGRYRSREIDWWKRVDLNNYVAQWGGEISIAHKTPFLLPENTTVYSDEDELERFVRDAGLQEDETGDVSIYQAFWLQHMATEEASRMIVYADLVDAVDPGVWDVAKTFYAEAIDDMLQENQL